MPIPKEPNKDLIFHQVTTRHEVAGGANRQDPSSTTTRSGRTGLNVEASEQFGELFWESGPDGQTESIQLKGATGGNEDTLEVAVYKALPTDPKPIAIKYDPKNRIFSFHLGATFKQYPKLRPIGTRECPVRLDRDATGRPCFVISIGAGTLKQRGKRATKNSGAAQPAAGAEPQADAE